VYFALDMDGGFRPDSGPSRGDPCGRAIRPNATSTVAIRNVRFTSTPAVRCAQVAVIPDARRTSQIDPCRPFVRGESVRRDHFAPDKSLRLRDAMEMLVGEFLPRVAFAKISLST
jgi:hypothetical protein